MVDENVEDKDIFRETWLRYTGYANEVGEAFRHLVSRRIVRGSYIGAISYVFADASTKSWRKFQESESLVQVADVAVDVFLWQMLASVIIPGYTINRITYLSRVMFKQAGARESMVKYMPTAVGLLSIPIIVHPIDRFVDFIMDKTFRANRTS
uniref:Mitochondrial fission process protein 1 n=1 Tax=Glossina brevipalpis TaxID=37001 RepID=A0A1A9WIK6_9MUSC